MEKGTKRGILTDGKGIPLSGTVDGANRHCKKLVKRTLDDIIFERPSPDNVIQNMLKDMIFPEIENWSKNMVILPISKATERKK